jgi:hypothetical protein
LLQRLPAEANLHGGQVFERAQFAERGTLARAPQIEDPRGDAQRALALLFAGLGGEQFVIAVDHRRSVQRLSDLDDGSVRDFRSGTQRQAAVGFQAVLAIERQQALGRERIAHGFREAFADPIQVGGLGMVEEGKNQNRFRVERGAEDRRKNQRP